MVSRGIDANTNESIIEQRLDQFMIENFLPHNKSSILICSVIINLYLIRHLHHLKYNPKIFTVKSVINEISVQHKIFGYNDKYVSQIIKQLTIWEILIAYNEGRDKYFLPLSQDIVQYLKKNRLIIIYAGILDEIIKYFMHLSDEKKNTFKSMVATKIFWDILLKTIDQDINMTIDLGKYHRSATLQNLRDLNLGQSIEDFNNQSILKHLYDLHVYTRKIVGIIIYPRHFLTNSDKKL